MISVGHWPKKQQQLELGVLRLRNLKPNWASIFSILQISNLTEEVSGIFFVFFAWNSCRQNCYYFLEVVDANFKGAAYINDVDDVGDDIAKVSIEPVERWEKGILALKIIDELTMWFFTIGESWSCLW